MEEKTVSHKNSRRRLGPILWPLLLIAFGLLLLLNTLGLLGQSAWEILWNLWPLFFIALGLDALFRKKEIFGPVFWIGLGGIFLLTNFGLFGWDTWSTLIRFWPLLLVTAGLEILLGKRSIWLSFLVSAVILAVLAVALGLTNVNTSTNTTIETNIHEPLGTSEQADVSITMGIGALNLYSLEDSGALISGEISTDGAHIRSQSTMRGGTITYSLEHSNPVMVPFDNVWKWNLGLSTLIPMELESTMGVGSMALTLYEIMMDELKVGQGVGKVEVILPEGDYHAEISQAVGQVLIEIPENVPIRLEISRVVSGLSIPSDFEKHNDHFYSPGAYGVDESIKIEINQAVGGIIIVYSKSTTTD